MTEPYRIVWAATEPVEHIPSDKSLVHLAGFDFAEVCRVEPPESLIAFCPCGELLVVFFDPEDPEEAF